MAHEHASAGMRHRGRLVAVLAMTASFMIVEAVVGFLTNSLVLIADAGHMLTDVAGLSLALLAIWFAQRPAMVVTPDLALPRSARVSQHTRIGHRDHPGVRSVGEDVLRSAVAGEPATLDTEDPE